MGIRCKPKPHRNSRGAAILEFTMVFAGFILPLTVAIFSFGRLIWQTQFLFDIAREASRQGALVSENAPTTSCDDLVNFTQSQGRAALQQASNLWGLNDIWRITAFTEAPRIFRANNANFGAPQAKIVMLTTLIDSGSPNCLFCYQNFLKQINITVTGASDLGLNSVCGS